jgi:hypothetical protein
MAIVVGQNSYITLTEANNYFTDKLYADGWNSATTVTKEIALKEACKRMNRLAFKGEKTDNVQLLAFPRVMPVLNRIGVIGFNSDTGIPEAVKSAQCEEALALIVHGNSARTKAQEQNVIRVNFGSVSEEYRAARKLLSGEALELLKPFLAGVVSIR